jgi:hypothetical protein
VRLLQREVARKLQVERDLGARPDVSTLTLWTSRTRGTATAAAWRPIAHLLVLAGSTWTTTSLSGRRLVHRLLDRVRGRVALADRSARRHADHHVREVAPRGLPQPEPAKVDVRRERRDRRRAAPRRLVGARSISTSTF